MQEMPQEGHFQAVYKSNSAVAELEQEEDAFLGAISDTIPAEPWTVT